MEIKLNEVERTTTLANYFSDAINSGARLFFYCFEITNLIESI